MSVDKSWLANPNRRSPEYLQGLDSFIEMCTKHLDSRGYIRCPCSKCQNTILIPFVKMRFHLHTFGICRTYKVWTHHGERLNPPVVAIDNVAPTNDIFNEVLGESRGHNRGIGRKPSLATSSKFVGHDEQEQTQPTFTQAQIENLFQNPTFQHQLSQFMASSKTTKKGEDFQEDTDEED